jgi:hypothetical protein
MSDADIINDLWLGVTILSIVASVISGSAAVTYFVERARTSEESLRSLTQGVEILNVIMNECIEMLQCIEENIPACSSYRRCLARYYDLMEMLEKLWTERANSWRVSSIIRIVRWLRVGGPS